MSPVKLQPGNRIKDVRSDEDFLAVDLFDGLTLSVSLAFYPRELHATPEQRSHWQIAGGGHGIHCSDVDEDLGAEGLLYGAPAPPKRKPLPDIGDTIVH